MLLKWIIAILLMICVISILTTYHNSREKYKKYRLQALVKSGIQTSKAEKYIGILTEAFGAIIIGIILLSILFNHYNEYILLGLVFGYLSTYYMNQYLPHVNWVIYQEGFISSRNRTCIEWQNIKDYRWLSNKSQHILIIEFKGKGIITQRADFRISSDQRQQVEQVLSERVRGY